jgi:hypothetical protein
MVIIINLDGEEEAQEGFHEEEKAEKEKKLTPEFYHFPQPQLIPIT